MGFGTCGTCKCDRCARNAELSLEYTTLGEIQDVALVCFFCDECRHWSGNPRQRSQWRRSCTGFQEAIKSIERRTQAARSKLRLIPGGGKQMG